MGRYIIKRVLLALPALLGLVLLTFVLVRVIPADPAAMLAGDAATPAQIAEIRTRYGLDQPLWRQAMTHIRQVMTGDLGSSIFTGRPVAEEIGFRLPATLELTFAALFLSVVFGVPLGDAPRPVPGRGTTRPNPPGRGHEAHNLLKSRIWMNQLWFVTEGQSALRQQSDIVQAW